MPRKPNSSPQARAILAALSAAPEVWRHGYDLSKLTGIKSGTLYPSLIRLHEQGFLDAQWLTDAEGGRPRHAYRLTGAGRALASSLGAEGVPGSLGGRVVESR